MWSPDHRSAARELLRSCRPGGTLELRSWCADGFVGEALLTIARHTPQSGLLAQPPGLWGTETYVRRLFGDGVSDIQAERVPCTFPYRSPDELLDYVCERHAPTRTAVAALDADARATLIEDLGDLAGRVARPVPVEYLRVVATRADRRKHSGRHAEILGLPGRRLAHSIATKTTTGGLA